jgi:hypothetical protein
MIMIGSSNMGQQKGRQTPNAQASAERKTSASRRSFRQAAKKSCVR